MALSRNWVVAWLLRSRLECGSPDAMKQEAARMRNRNTRELLEREAALWLAELEMRNQRRA